MTLHSLLDRDVYRGGAIVVGPVRRGRGRRVRVERRVLPVTPDPERRAEVFERELWRIAVEHLDYGEQHVWAALAGARVAPNGWRRAKAMLHFDRGGELKRRFLLTALQRNRNSQLRLRALQEIAASRDAEAFDTAIDIMAGWPRDERREGVKIMLQALAERRIGRRDQANAWIWRMAEYTREVHEEYAVQRWPETKRLLGLLVNSSGAAHARNARRLVHAARKEDRRLSAALLAAALAHTPEAEEALRGARTRMARKPAALARELLRNFPKGRRGKGRRRRKPGGGAQVPPEEGGRGRDGRSRPTTNEDRHGNGVSIDATDDVDELDRDDEDGADVDDDDDDDDDLEDSGDDDRFGRRRRTTRPTTTSTTNRPPRTTAPKRPPSRAVLLPRWTSPASSVTRACARLDDQAPVPSTPAASPCPPAHRTGSPSRASRARTPSRMSPGSASIQRLSESSSRSSVGSIASGSSPSVPALPRSSAGKSSVRTATFRPMPSTAHRSCGRPSTRIPATLRPPSRTSLGHFSRACGPTTSAVATPAASGSSRSGSRITTDSSSALPAGATHVLPWRPRPADCSPCRHRRAMGRAARSQLAGVGVGRVDVAEVEPRRNPVLGSLRA